MGIELTIFNCREISKLVSESMDRELPLYQRMQVRIHLMMCSLCVRFARQMRLLRRAIHEHPERLAPDEAAPEARLSEDARERIKASLRRGNG